MLVASGMYGQTDTIPNSSTRPFFDRQDARQFVSWDLSDTLAVYFQGDTIFLSGTDSIWVSKLLNSTGTSGGVTDHGALDGLLDDDHPHYWSNTEITTTDTTRWGTDADASNELQDISTDGSAGNLSISSGSEVTINVDDADASTTNEIQDIATDGSPGNVSISNGSALNINVDDADASTTNEIQGLQSVVEQQNYADHVVYITNASYSNNAIKGLGMYYNAGADIAVLQSYDGPSDTYTELQLNGSPITFGNLDFELKPDMVDVRSGDLFIRNGKLDVGGMGSFDGQISTQGAIKIGGPGYAYAGYMRWTGTDFEGHNGSSWVSLTSGGGVSNFLDLGDTPSSFTADKWVKVNAAGDALMWTDAPSGTGTDDQILYIDSTSRVFDITIENGNTVSFEDTYQDADSDPTNEYNSFLSLSGTTLQIGDGGATLEQDLSSLQDGTGTDNQTLTFNSPNLSIESGNTVNLSALQDGTGTDDQNLNSTGNPGYVGIENGTGVTINVNDLDADPTNEYNTQLALSGTTLTITDGGGTLEQDLSTLQSGGSETQTLSFSSPNLSISGGNTVNLSALQDGTGTDDQNLSTDGTPGDVNIENGTGVTLNVNDADSDATNEYNTGAGWNNLNNTISITDGGGTQFVEITGFVEVEEDPVYSNDPAFGITSTDINEWNSAHSHSTTITGNPHNIGLSDATANDNTTNSDIYANDFILNSDRRLKKNIHPFADSLAALNLNPVQFKWRNNGAYDAGFIAQDLLANFPYLVKQRPNGYFGISYAKITALNNAVIQHLYKENQQLKDKIKKIETWLEENTSYPQ